MSDLWQRIQRLAENRTGARPAADPTQYKPTERELEALRAIVKHGTIREAARSLGTSRDSAVARLRSLRAATACPHLPQLVFLAETNGWLEGCDLP